MPVTKICEECGKEFSVFPNRKDKARWCSQECRKKSGYMEKRFHVTATCLFCGKEFETYPAWIRKGAAKYCSRECQNKGYRNLDVSTQKVVRLYEDGLSSVQIAKKLNTTATLVRRRLHSKHIDMRTAAEGIGLAYKELHGPNNKNWKGPRQLHKKRKDHHYWMIYKPEDLKANKGGFVYEHIYNWEKANDKQVPKGWVVHHKNGVSTDNRPENLEAMSRGKHTKFHNDLREKELIDAKDRIKQLEAEIERLKAKL